MTELFSPDQLPTTPAAVQPAKQKPQPHEVAPVVLAPAPSPPKELTPADPLPISIEMRMLLGRSPFRDPALQVEVERVLGVLAQDFRAKSYMELKLLERISTLHFEVRRLQSTVETAFALRRGDAAREIIKPGFNHFYPPAPTVNACTTVGYTAYGDFMNEGGERLARRKDGDVIDEALKILAEQGLGEDELNHQAYILALPTVERLEKLIATKSADAENLLEQLYRLIERSARFSAIPGSATEK